MKKIKLYLFITVIGLVLNSCSKEKINPPIFEPSTESVTNFQLEAVSAGFPEAFESGTKTAHAAASVSLSSGSW